MAKSSGAASLPEELSFIFNYSFSAAGEILPFCLFYATIEVRGGAECESIGTGFVLCRG